MLSSSSITFYSALLLFLVPLGACGDEVSSQSPSQDTPSSCKLLSSFPITLQCGDELITLPEDSPGPPGQDGMDGADGVHGMDGADGVSPLIEIIELPVGSMQCPRGGEEIRVMQNEEEVFYHVRCESPCVAGQRLDKDAQRCLDVVGVKWEGFVLDVHEDFPEHHLPGRRITTDPLGLGDPHATTCQASLWLPLDPVARTRDASEATYTLGSSHLFGLTLKVEDHTYTRDASIPASAYDLLMTRTLTGEDEVEPALQVMLSQRGIRGEVMGEEEVVMRLDGGMPLNTSEARAHMDRWLDVPHTAQGWFELLGDVSMETITVEVTQTTGTHEGEVSSLTCLMTHVARLP